MTKRTEANVRRYRMKLLRKEARKVHTARMVVAPQLQEKPNWVCNDWRPVFLYANTSKMKAKVLCRACTFVTRVELNDEETTTR